MPASPFNAIGTTGTLRPYRDCLESKRGDGRG
jgi:hypothetical protein